MNLHDWIDELCDTLDIETEVDEGLISDLAKAAATNVEPRAATVTAYLLGIAVGARDADPATIEDLASQAQQLAVEWDRPGAAPDPDDPGDDVPDDRGIDHGGDDYVDHAEDLEDVSEEAPAGY